MMRGSLEKIYRSSQKKVFYLPQIFYQGEGGRTDCPPDENAWEGVGDYQWIYSPKFSWTMQTHIYRRCAV